jgi:hypothetical protein
MLDRNLREDSYPAHAAEVRENMVPRTLSTASCETGSQSEIRYTRRHRSDASSLHPLLARRPIARTLAYERDLKAYRLNEIEACRGDPGRPAYNEVHGVSGL